MRSKKFIGGAVFGLLCSIAVAASSGPALAADNANQLNLSFSDRDDRFGINLAYMRALSGSLSDEGMLIRLGIGAGDSDEGEGSRSVDALIGYQFLVGDWKVRTFGGVTYVEQDTDGVFGLKVLGQVQNSRKSDIYVSASASYSSPRELFAATLQLGGQAAGVIVGPDLGITYTPELTRTRLGLFLTGIRLGDVGVSFRAGYSFAEVDGGAEASPYAGMSGNLQF